MMPETRSEKTVVRKISRRIPPNLVAAGSEHDPNGIHICLHAQSHCSAGPHCTPNDDRREYVRKRACHQDPPDAHLGVVAQFAKQRARFSETSSRGESAVRKQALPFFGTATFAKCINVSKAMVPCTLMSLARR